MVPRARARQCYVPYLMAQLEHVTGAGEESAAEEQFRSEQLRIEDPDGEPVVTFYGESQRGILRMEAAQ